MHSAPALCVACVVATATAALARSAHAGPAFGLDYSAPAACPNRATFMADVERRIAGRATGDQQEFRVRIDGDRSAYHGTLETSDPPSVRDVSGESCDEVVRALAVFLALAISPPQAEMPPLVPAPPRPEVKPPTSPKPAPRTRRPRVGFDVHGVVVGGIMPGLAPGGAVSASLFFPLQRPFGWIAHAGGIVAYDEEPALIGRFVFVWSAVRIDTGPTMDVGRFRLSAGPALHSGVLSVRARGLPSAAEFSGFWQDLGGFARVDWLVARPVALSLMVELVATMTRRRTFGIQAVEAPIHEIPPVAALLSFGVAFRP